MAVGGRWAAWAHTVWGALCAHRPVGEALISDPAYGGHMPESRPLFHLCRTPYLSSHTSVSGFPARPDYLLPGPEGNPGHPLPCPIAALKLKAKARDPPADYQPLPLTLSCQRGLLSGASKGSTTHPPCSQGSNWLSPEGFRVVLLKIVSFSDQSSTHCCLGDMCWGRCSAHCSAPPGPGGSAMSPLDWGPTPASNQPQFWLPKARPAQGCPDSPAHPGSLLAGSTVGVQRNTSLTPTPQNTHEDQPTLSHPRTSITLGPAPLPSWVR